MRYDRSKKMKNKEQIVCIKSYANETTRRMSSFDVDDTTVFTLSNNDKMILVPFDEFRETLFYDSILVDEYREVDSDIDSFSIPNELYSKHLMTSAENLKIDNVNDFEMFSKMADYFGIHSLPHAIYSFILEFMGILSSSYIIHSDEYREKKALLMEAWKMPQFQEEIHKITDMDSHPRSDTNYIWMASSVSLNYVEFIYKTSEHYRRIQPILEKSLHRCMEYIIENGEDERHFELFEYILKNEVYASDGNCSEQEYHLLECVCNTSIRTKHMTYLKYLLQNIVPLYVKGKRIIFIRLIQENTRFLSDEDINNICEWYPLGAKLKRFLPKAGFDHKKR
jgi:hypothetical protein